MQLSANTEVLKEPRGFIKFIEIFLAICAFATAVGPHIAASYKCCGSQNQMLHLSMEYPYGECESDLTATVCQCTTTVTPSSVTPADNATEPIAVTSTAPSVVTKDFELPAECQSSSQFYVFVGVTAFLFSLAAIAIYVFAQEQYAGLAIIPKADFVMTIVFTLFWLISSSAFAAAVSKIKTATDPNWLSNSDNVNIHQCFAKSVCVSDQGGNFATLNVSIIFGFLNMIVWGGNNWFLYKETNWFGTESPSNLPPQSVSASTSEIQPKV